MEDSQDHEAVGHASLSSDDPVFYEALAQAPFAVLLFKPDERFTLLWRNNAHEVMSDSVGACIAGKGMFEAFPPSENEGASAARKAITEAVARIRETGQTEEIGPYRFDLMDQDGVYGERHWLMRMSPILHERKLVAIMQVAQDMTSRVLLERLDQSLKRTAQVSAAISFFSYDPETGHFSRSSDVDRMFGFAPGEAGPLAGPFFDRLDPDDLPAVQREVERVFAAKRGDVAHFDYRIRRPDGTEGFIRARGEVATDPVDLRVKLVGSFIDLTDIEQNRRALAREVTMRTALAAEANHRIKNSLAIALSMIRMEKKALRAVPEITADTAIDALSGVETRIRAVSSVHELMQLGNAGTEVSLNDLLQRLVSYSREGAGLGLEELDIETQSGDVTIRSDLGINIGLILNELLTNAIKYGTRENAGTRIRVSSFSGNRVIELVVTNSISERGQERQVPSSNLGARLTQEIADQIGASLCLKEEDGLFSAKLTVPFEDR